MKIGPLEIAAMTPRYDVVSLVAASLGLHMPRKKPSQRWHVFESSGRLVYRGDRLSEVLVFLERYKPPESDLRVDIGSHHPSR